MIWRQRSPRGAEESSGGMAARSVCFGALLGVTLAAFWVPLTTLMRLSIERELYSYIVVIPLISAALVILERERIFAHAETCWPGGVALLSAGALVYAFGRTHPDSASENDKLSIAIFSLVVVWLGGFVLVYGIRAVRMGLFPVFFLFLMVPTPDFVLEGATGGLQTASADVSHLLFGLLGVPVLRTGFVFSLPGITIEIAKECSGIRSSTALLILSLLIGHFFLRAAWTKAVLTLASLPLLIVKNGLRIVTLSLLSVYVDPRFLTGRLHQQGGIVFFLLALVLLAFVLGLLQKSERGMRAKTV